MTIFKVHRLLRKNWQGFKDFKLLFTQGSYAWFEWYRPDSNMHSQKHFTWKNYLCQILLTKKKTRNFFQAFLFTFTYLIFVGLKWKPMSLACGLQQLPSFQKSLMICWQNFKLFNVVKNICRTRKKKFSELLSRRRLNATPPYEMQLMMMMIFCINFTFYRPPWMTWRTSFWWVQTLSVSQETLIYYR